MCGGEGGFLGEAGDAWVSLEGLASFRTEVGKRSEEQPVLRVAAPGEVWWPWSSVAGLPHGAWGSLWLLSGSSRAQ